MKETDDTKLDEINLAVETGITNPEFWHSRTPHERIRAMELMRQRDYGYDEHSAPRIQRVIEIAMLKHYEPRPGAADSSADLPKEQS
jgi:hypothetical protein